MENELLNQYKDLNFKGQQAHERVVCFFRKHWITMWHYFVLLGIVFILSSWFFLRIGSLRESLSPFLFKVFFLFTIAIVFFYIHYFLLKVVEHFFTVAIVTNCRIVYLRKTLFIIDEKESCDLKMIQEINKHQNGILPNLLRYGDLTITLSQSTATLHLTNIPNPEYHFRVITRTQQAYIQDRIRQKIEMQQDAREKGGLVEPASSELPYMTYAPALESDVDEG